MCGGPRSLKPGEQGIAPDWFNGAVGSSVKDGVGGSGPRDRMDDSGVRVDSSVKGRMDSSGPSGGANDSDARVDQGARDGVNSS